MAFMKVLIMFIMSHSIHLSFSFQLPTGHQEDLKILLDGPLDDKAHSCDFGGDIPKVCCNQTEELDNEITESEELPNSLNGRKGNNRVA